MAKGNYKNGSDVDLCLIGKNLTHRTVSKVSTFLNEETMMPYHFDVLNFGDLTNVELMSHIQRNGKSIFE